VVLSIGLIGAGRTAADYYVARQAGCSLDYYTGAGERRGHWIGAGATGLGLSGELDADGERVLRGLLAGLAPDGSTLVPGLRRHDPRSRVPAAPLVAAVRAAATTAGLPLEMLLDAGAARDFARAARGLTRSTRASAGIRADAAVRIATAAGLDPHAIYAASTRQSPDLLTTALGHLGSRVDARRAGVDLTFSAPKSVSLLFAFGTGEQAAAVRAAHETAISEALAYLDRVAGHGVRGHHGDGQTATRIGSDGLLGVAFEHRTSRAGDPQLHTHVVVPNLLHGADGRWSALDTRALHRHARTAGHLYQAVLRGELTTALGVRWGPVRRGQGDLAGIPRETLAVFSTRRAQINDALETTGAGGGRAAQLACLTTRPEKIPPPGSLGGPAADAVGAVGLRASWVARAMATGIDPEQLLRDVTVDSPSPRPGPRRETGTSSGVPVTVVGDLLGPHGLTEHATSFTRDDVLRALCDALPAGTAVDHQGLQEMANVVLSDPRTVALTGASEGLGSVPRWTCRDLLATESRALALASELSASLDPGCARHVVASRLRHDQVLNAEQTAMVRDLTEPGPRLRLVIGPAGSGKTAALAATKHLWSGQGRAVRGVALSAIAARGLHDATGIPSSSIAALLDQLDRGRANVPPSTVLVVDEAGMVGTRTMTRLLAHARDHQMTVVLLGDPAQLPEIGAGGLFTHLTTHTPTTVLTANHRQTHPWEQSALTRLRDGDIPAALDTYLRHQRITFSPDHDQLQDTIARDYLTHLDHRRSHHGNNTASASSTPQGSGRRPPQSSRATGHGDVLVVTASRRHTTQLNDRIRELLSARGDLTGPELTCRGGETPLALRAGDHVLITANDHQRGLLNGEHASVTHIDTENRRVTLATGDLRELTVPAAWASEHLDHGYALTAHKAQGQTVEVTLIAGSTALTRETTYTALSRGRATNHLYLAPDTALDPADQAAQSWLTDHALADTTRHLQTSRRQILATTQQPHGHDHGYDHGPDYPSPSSSTPALGI
jgi:conjugative relaxase-like TrwC/TraI family protein